MTFHPGDHVLILPLNKSGVIHKAISRNTFEVRIGNLSMRCKKSDLRKIEKKNSPKKHVPKGAFSPPSNQNQKHSLRSAPQSIDFHGKRVHEALEALDHALDAALRAGHDSFRIVHGIGKGKVQEAVHNRLREISAVKHFKIDEGNPGVTVVYF